MSTVRFGDFAWDSRKAAANLRKPSVTFEEAATVFDDPQAIDAPNLYDKERHAFHMGPAQARKATPHERKAYESE